MKNIIPDVKKPLASLLKSIVPALIIAVLFIGTASAEVFLKTNRIEVGIHNSGSFGTSGSAPSGYHPRSCCRLGFVADWDRNGFDVGVGSAPPFAGDFFVPGSPEEGWAVEWNNSSGGQVTRGNFGLNGLHQVIMSSLTNTSSGTTQQAVWQGLATSGSDKLQVTQTVTFHENDLFFVMNVVLTNVGTTTLNSVEYMRNVDPDQEQPWTGQFTTDNWVEFQPPRPASGTRVALAARPAGNVSKALAVARGLNHGMTLGLGTIDPRAVVAASHGFANRDPDSILNNPTQPTSAAKSRRDSAIVLAYELGSLAPGQSTTVDYAYILDAADLEPALGSLAAVTILQPTGTVSGDGVIFQATTDDLPNTIKIEFFVEGSLVGTDSSADAGGVFATTFDSRPFPNGPVTIKAVATFSGGKVVEKTSSVTVENAGPPIAFNAPSPGQALTGSGIPTGVNILDPSHPPVRVSFFRETASTGSLFLGEDPSAPFTSVFDVTGLPEGETVVIKAVGTDAFGKSTTITVSGTVVVNRPPSADAGSDQIIEQTGSTTSVMLDGSGSFDLDGDPLDYSWSGSSATHSFGPVLGVTPTVPLEAGNWTITLTVNDGTATDSDTVQVLVEDTTVPVFPTPPGDIAVFTDPGLPSAVVSFADPTATDNDSATVAQIGGLASGSAFLIGVSTVTFRATDPSTNTADVSFTVTVTDNENPVFPTPPGDIAVFTDLGLPSAVVSFADPAATDNDSATVAQIGGLASGSAFPIGVSTVTFRATDPSTNTADVSFTVTVTDNENPVFPTPPGDIAVFTDLGLPSAVVSFADPTATDNDSATVAHFAGPVSGSAFPLGASTVTFRATDSSGNTADVSFTVTVSDNEDPVIAAPADVTDAAATGSLTSVDLGSPVTSDNVGVVSITNDAPVAGFPVDSTTTVTWTATDAAGNTASATQTVTVEPFDLGVAIGKTKLKIHHHHGDKDKDKDKDKDNDRGPKDWLQIAGTLTEFSNGDGLNFLTDPVTIVLNGFTWNLPPGSFVQKTHDGDKDKDGDHGVHYKYKGGRTGLTEVKVDENGKFKLKVKRMDLSGLSFGTPIPFSVTVGNDFGETDVTFNTRRGKDDDDKGKDKDKDKDDDKGGKKGKK